MPSPCSSLCSYLAFGTNEPALGAVAPGVRVKSSHSRIDGFTSISTFLHYLTLVQRMPANLAETRIQSEVIPFQDQIQSAVSKIGLFDIDDGAVAITRASRLCWHIFLALFVRARCSIGLVLCGHSCRLRLSCSSVGLPLRRHSSFIAITSMHRSRQK